MQGMMMIKREGLNEDDAQAFIQFMISDRAKEILNTYGYRTTFGQ
jgi:accessory colonization factor AcfC